MVGMRSIITFPNDEGDFSSDVDFHRETLTILIEDTEASVCLKFPPSKISYHDLRHYESKNSLDTLATSTYRSFQ